MKKLPHKFKFPLIASIMMPTMLLGMPAIMTYRNLSEGEPLLELWLTTVEQTVPPALLMAVVVGSLARFFVTKVLVEPHEA